MKKPTIENILFKRVIKLFVEGILGEYFRPLQPQLHDKSTDAFVSFMYDDKANNSAAVIQMNFGNSAGNDTEINSIDQSR